MSKPKTKQTMTKDQEKQVTKTLVKMLEAVLSFMDKTLPPDHRTENRREFSREHGDQLRQLFQPHIKPMLEKFLAETDHPALNELRTFDRGQQVALLSFELNRASWDVLEDMLDK